MSVLDKFRGKPKVRADHFPQAYVHPKLAIIATTELLEELTSVTDYHVAEAWRILSDPTYKDFFIMRRLQGAYVMVQTQIMHLNDDVVVAASMINAQEVHLIASTEYPEISLQMGLSWRRMAKWKHHVAVTLTGRDIDEISRCQLAMIDEGFNSFLIGAAAGRWIFDDYFPWIRDGSVRYHLLDEGIDNPAQISRIAQMGVLRGVDTSAPIDAAVRGLFLDVVRGWQRPGRISLDGIPPSMSVDRLAVAHHNVLAVMRWANGYGVNDGD